MALNDLTTVARVKAYVGTAGVTDAVLGMMITRISAALLSNMNRDTIALRVYNDTYDGPGRQRLMLRNFPVHDVMSLSVGNISVPLSAGPPLQAGYYLSAWDGVPPGIPQALNVASYCFNRGLDNVSVSYLAGYGVIDEPATVPSSGEFKVVPLQPWGMFATDYKVTYADGAQLVRVASNPQQGQYIAPTPLLTPSTCVDYVFSAADAGKAVLLSYSYIPDAIEGAAAQFAAEQWQYRDRIGLASKSLGGQETVSYIVKAIPDYVSMAVQSFRNVIPLG